MRKPRTQTPAIAKVVLAQLTLRWRHWVLQLKWVLF